jgi:hypothetical protein
MGRIVILLALLFALLWQSMALGRPGSSIHVLADREHAALHWNQEGHHHHDDGSVHVDDSQASMLHLLGDPLTATTALLPAVSHHFSPIPTERPGGLHHARVPDPFLGGLLRPPRPRA